MSYALPIAMSIQFTQTKYTFGFLNLDDLYHRNVIRSKLTRNTTPTFDQVHDELLGAVRECIPAAGKGIVLLPPKETHRWLHLLSQNGSSLYPANHLICRISSRVFVGAPLCAWPFISLVIHLP